MRRTADVIALAMAAVIAGCSAGDGKLAHDAALEDSSYIELELATGRVSAIAPPSTAALAGDRWRSSHMLFRYVSHGTAPATASGLPAGGEAEDSVRLHADGGWLAVFEMTASQWRALSADPGAEHGEMPATGLAPALVHAVVDASRLERFHLELPDDALWRRACGGGRAELFSWGSSQQPLVAKDHAVHYDAAAGMPAGAQRVGSLRPNSSGFYDMHGNAAEVATTGGGYAVHGGAWDSPLLACRTANQVALPARTAHPAVGYRLAIRP